MDCIISGDCQSCGPTILRARRPFAVDQVRFGIHRRAVIDWPIFLVASTIRGENHVIIREEFFVGVLIFVHAQAEDDAAFRRNLPLQRVERLGFLKTWRAPGRPKIEDHDLAAQIGQMRSAWDLQREVLGFAPGKARFALTVTRRGEHVQNSCCDNECQRTEDFMLQ